MVSNKNRLKFKIISDRYKSEDRRKFTSQILKNAIHINLVVFLFDQKIFV